MHCRSGRACAACLTNNYPDELITQGCVGLDPYGPSRLERLSAFALREQKMCFLLVVVRQRSGRVSRLQGIAYNGFLLLLREKSRNVNGTNRAICYGHGDEAHRGTLAKAGALERLVIR